MTQHRNALHPGVRTPSNVEPGAGGTGRAIRAGMTKQNTPLETHAYEAGRRARNAIRRGDTTTVDAFYASGVGYPYMTAPEAAKALAAFKQGAR